MNPMVERVARVICFAITPTLCCNACSCTDECRDLGEHRATARTVFESIREPTKEMIVQGAMAGELYGNTDAEASWQAMIDEALK